MSDIEARVKKIIAEQLGVPEADVANEKAFVADLGADSLDIVELVMELEEEFEITIPDDQAEKIKTVGEAIENVPAKFFKEADLWVKHKTPVLVVKTDNEIPKE